MRTAERSWKDLTVRYRVLPIEEDAGAPAEVELLDIYGPKHQPLTPEQVQALKWAGTIDLIMTEIEEEELS